MGKSNIKKTVILSISDFVQKKTLSFSKSVNTILKSVAYVSRGKILEAFRKQQ